MNWGKAIVLSFVIFIAFIMTMVVMMYQENIDLVADDYYVQELEYQNQIVKQENLNAVVGKIDISRNMEFIFINFPKELHDKALSGAVTFYRASEAALDFSQDLEIDQNGVMAIPNKKLKPGKWKVKMEFQSADGTPYLYHETLFI
ncbi:MAG: FixH family protein [Schleiferiaceae bacterium]|jgi:nitrogen fixation protein FixH|nr:FixH family protein [Schleiferiaceae bacterium]